ncbi:excinuclease ABC subunit UvrC [Halobacteriovorax sp. JY17]|uniref:excinuclease ABC subunit UvrC n=1 Tax=Halobacteriovorax sp. JY17 TaxID=2014617 RepID=UPI0025BA696A|nr:excinuclease ABC subunit UvrC [Halobacteriovorax sp. JY17]
MNKVKTERNANMHNNLLEKAKTLPNKAGCYLMKRIRAGEETVLYVGKAKNLRNRVSSYFNNSSKSPKTEILVSHINDFDFIMTDSDAEAFVLENNLIKKFSPKYNIRLKDDKSYPYVCVNSNEEFPRIMYERRPKKQKNVEVFGPFVVGSNISEVIRILTKSFNLRDCTLKDFNSRKEPCLLYQMKQCSAPCVNYISNEEYKKDLDLALSFFRGAGTKGLKELERRMFQFAEGEHFERAAILRDHISVLNEFLNFSKQNNAEVSHTVRNVDILAYHVGDIEVDISLYMMREGVLLGHKSFHFPSIDCSDDFDDEVAQYIFQYYTTTFDKLPDRVITSFPKSLNETLHIAFKQVHELDIKCSAPGKKFESLMKLTKDHAFEHQRVRILNEESTYVGLNKLKELLGLKERPVTLECYDVAIFQGKSPTASQIVFNDGRADKKSYRHYHLEERPEGNNDFAMMSEVINRRVKKGSLPDVFIVDGGIGQVNIFLEALKDHDISIPVVGIAKSKVDKKSNFKSKEVVRSEERLIIPGRSNPYLLAKCKSLFRIIVQMRDEAHRFSRRLHHKEERKKLITSWVDHVEGVGPVAKKKILSNLDLSIKELKLMSEVEIQEYFVVSKKIAKAIVKTLALY